MTQSPPGHWQRELDDYVRAASGAFLFGTPLLFTMEMWWLGEYAHVWKLLALLAVALIANLGLAHFAGFKHRADATLGGTLNQAVDALAVGVVASIVVLATLNRFSPDDPLDSILGKIVVQTVPLSIGASVANLVFAPGRGRQGDDTQNGNEEDEIGPAGQRDVGDGAGDDCQEQGANQGARSGAWRPVLHDIGATLTGGAFLGFSIAPTEEVPMLAAGLTYGHQIALIGLSLALTYIIVFESGFDPGRVQETRGAPLRSPVGETAMAYVVSLLVALAAVFLLNQADLGDPPLSVMRQVLVLGLPTAIGGAAGRLVV